MNCVIIDDDKLSRKLIESFIEKTEFLKHVASFSNAVEAINSDKIKESIDLIFLDVEMPEMTGVEFLQSLQSKPQIIFISSQEKYALQAFEYDVTDYLLKPITYSRFYKAVNKANSRVRRKEDFIEERNEIFIKNNSSLIRLKYDDIIWIEALENYVVVNTYHDKYTIHFTMKAISEKMPSTKFVRVHRSYIVNLNKIEMLEDNSVVVDTETGQKNIPIGKSYKDNLMRDINLMTK